MFKLAVLAILSIFAVSVYSDNCELRPFWNILHFADSIQFIKDNLKSSPGHFNGIHAYVNFDEYDTPSLVSHEPPCDSFSNHTVQQRFDEYLDYVRRLTSSGNNEYRKEIVLVHFEVNLVKLNNDDQYKAGENFARTLAEKFFRSNNGIGSQAYVLLQIDSIINDPFVRGFTDAQNKNLFSRDLVKLMNDRVGWNIHQDYASVGSEYRFFFYYDIKNIWFSSGKEACSTMNYRNLMLRIAVRDRYVDVNDVVVNKVFIWNVDDQTVIRNALILRVDAILTNRPNVVFNQLKDPRFAHEFALAGPNDNPWVKFPLLEEHTK